MEEEVKRKGTQRIERGGREAEIKKRVRKRQNETDKKTCKKRKEERKQKKNVQDLDEKERKVENN